jgi:hypothetical protein
MRFYNGMNVCAAKYQCFFIDACRSDVDLVALGNGAAGRYLVFKPVGATTKQQPAYYSTQKGALAHAPKGGKPSYFTQALLRALGGTGSVREQGEWRVQTVRLQEALSKHMLRLKKSQIPPADGLTLFPITRMPATTPVVPVFITSSPSSAYANLKLRCRNNNQVFHDAKMTTEQVELELQVGPYDFDVEATAPYTNASRTEYVLPPEHEVVVP